MRRLVRLAPFVLGWTILGIVVPRVAVRSHQHAGGEQPHVHLSFLADEDHEHAHTHHHDAAAYGHWPRPSHHPDHEGHRPRAHRAGHRRDRLDAFVPAAAAKAKRAVPAHTVRLATGQRPLHTHWQAPFHPSVRSAADPPPSYSPIRPVQIAAAQRPLGAPRPVVRSRGPPPPPSC